MDIKVSKEQTVHKSFQREAVHKAEGKARSISVAKLCLSHARSLFEMIGCCQCVANWNPTQQFRQDSFDFRIFAIWGEKVQIEVHLHKKVKGSRDAFLF